MKIESGDFTLNSPIPRCIQARLKGEELEEELTSSRNCELTMDVIYVYRSEQEDTRNA